MSVTLCRNPQNLRTLSRNYLSVCLICSSRPLPLSLFLTSMCSPQGATEEHCLRINGCERKIQHPLTCWDARVKGWLSLECGCVKITHAMEQDGLSQSLHRWAFTHLCVFPRLLAWHCSCTHVCVCTCFCFMLVAWVGPPCLPVFLHVGWQQLAWSEQSKRAWQKIPQCQALKKCRRPLHAEASKVNV